MLLKVHSHGNIVLADRRLGLNLDSNSVNYLGVFLVSESCKKGTEKGLRHVCSCLEAIKVRQLAVYPETKCINYRSKLSRITYIIFCYLSFISLL